MQFPGPVRAVVGLLANAADEAKHLPDRAIELPMLAVSTALQMSLRAQQRYARLAARGDEVLSRRPSSDDPPPWATFDEPVSIDEVRAAALTADGAQAASDLLDELFGGADGQPDRDHAGNNGVAAAGKAPVTKAPAKTPATKAPVTKAPVTKAPVTKAPVTKAPADKPAANAPATEEPATTAPITKAATKAPAAKKAAAKAPAATKAPAGKAPAKKTATSPASPAAAETGKAVSKPRHTAPSRFDAVDDE
jgi:hypothetical protein